MQQDHPEIKQEFQFLTQQQVHTRQNFAKENNYKISSVFLY